MPLHRIVSLCGIMLLPAAAFGQATSPPRERLDFLVGNWVTASETMRSDTIPGDLEYRWVLGDQWLQVVFDGHPPDGSVWQAHAMVKYDADAGEYVSYAFFNGDDPLRYRGYALDDTTLRFEHMGDEGMFGIDYRDNVDGTVYQENWLMSPDGERRVTLRTWYTRAE